MRIIRGVAALLALIGLLIGIPVALAVFGGNPFPTSLTGDAVWRALIAPASDRTLIGIIAIIGWLAWAGFAVSVAAELLNTIRPRRAQIRIPGLQLGQQLAAVLLIAIVAMLAAPTLFTGHSTGPTDPALDTHAPTRIATTTTGPTAPAGPVAVTSTSVASRPSTVGQAETQPVRDAATTTTRSTVQHVAAEAGRGRKAPDHQVHVVKRGEWLWTLAEEYLGDGSRWRDIADANPGINPDRLAVGQKLRIPVPATPEPATAGDTVTVQRGDTLTSLAEDLYDDPSKWRDLYRANQSTITDPDLIDVGQQLTVPDADHKADSTDTRTAKADKGGDDRKGAKGEGKGSDKPSAAPAKPAPEPSATTAPTPAPTPSATRSSAPTRTGSAPGPTVAAQPPVDFQATGSKQVSVTDAVAPVSVGMLLAAGLITTLNLRRRRQLRSRPVGRRIAHPDEPARQLEQEIKIQHQPLGAEQLDCILRAISAHCHTTGDELPALSAVRVADNRIDMLLRQPANDAPAGIEVGADGSVWTIHASNVSVLSTIDGADDAAPPYPALVTLGRDADTASILIDLEAASALTITAEDPDAANAMLTTIALELAMSPWAADLNITLAGPLVPGLAEALDHPSLTQTNDVDAALTALEARAVAQRDLLGDRSVASQRTDGDLADAWCPHVVLIAQPLTATQAKRLTEIVSGSPRVAIAAVTTGPAPITSWQCSLSDGVSTGHLDPHNWDLTPPLITGDQYRLILELLDRSGTEETTPAPWWDDTSDPEPPAEPPATVTVLADRSGRPKPAAAHTSLTLHTLIPGKGNAQNRTDTSGQPVTVDGDQQPEPIDLDAILEQVERPAHPFLRILGEPELVGARGQISTRYKQRSMEMLLFLLENPGASSTTITNQLCISRDYAKSVISSLRKTLGADDDDLYLPELTSAAGPGYRLHDQVRSDWDRMKRLVGRGVNTAATENLISALNLVRGRPLAGAEDWAGANVLRPDAASMISDIAHELVERCLDRNDYKVGRWATTQGLLAHPESETLLTDQLRLEDQAGNRTDVERLAGRISANARQLGVDLLDETREVLRATATR